MLVPLPEPLLEPLPVPPTEESVLLVLILPSPEPLRRLLVLLFVLAPVPNEPFDDVEPLLPEVDEPAGVP